MRVCVCVCEYCILSVCEHCILGSDLLVNHTHYSNASSIV